LFRVVVEFIADLFPHAGIMPADPVQRAQARFFVDAVGTKFVSPWLAYVMKGENGSSFMDAAAALEKLLSAKYAVGDQITAADIAFVPFLLRTEYGLKLRDTESVLAQLQERTPRLWQYYVDVKAHPSVQKTWDEVSYHTVKGTELTSVFSTGWVLQALSDARSWGKVGMPNAIDLQGTPLYTIHATKMISLRPRLMSNAWPRTHALHSNPACKTAKGLCNGGHQKSVLK
jgi:hypothetical protein